MDLLDYFAQYGSWSWVIFGFILLAIELVVPGGVFVWLGMAAIATGLVSLILPIDFAWQWVLYGVLSLSGVVLWLKFGRKAMNSETDSPFLNKRAERFVGREAVLEEAISQGFGRVKMDDTTWRVSGKDMRKGTRVKIVGHDGVILKVEPVDN